MFHTPLGRKAILVGAAAVMALGASLAPVIAAAQPEPPPPASYEDCQHAKAGNAVAGAIVGGIIGGVLGSNIAASGHRGAGTAIGAGVGAVGGAAVGSGSTNCDEPPPPPYDDRYDNAPPPPESYQDRGYYQDGDQYDQSGDRYDDRGGQYDAGPPPEQGQGYDSYNSYNSYNSYDDQDAGPPPDEDGDRCTTAESPIYMPDGTVERHTVRVCPDENGRYRPVD